MRRIFSIVAAVVLVASAAVASEKPSLVGHWFGQAFQPSGVFTQWINDRRADHTYVVRFLVFSDCRQTGAAVESGTWRFDGQRLLQIASKVNGKATDTAKPNFRNYYRVTWVDASHIEYVEEASEAKYAARRVAADFAFPPCKLP